MNNKHNDNLEELFGTFLDSKAAGQAAEDIEKGLAILEKYPAPKPSRKLLEDIKLQMEGTAILQRSVTRRRTIYKYAAAAAIIMIAATLSLKIFEKPSIIPTITGWRSSFWQDEDEQLTMLATQVTNLESDAGSANLDDYDNDSIQNEVIELEMKVIEEGTDFWRG